MRMMSGIPLAGALTVALLAFAWWYALVVPGRPHAGPLPPATNDEQDIATRLKGHVVAIASVPHNMQHYPALERAAQYIEGTLQGLGYAVTPQVFAVAGRPLRNIEVQRAAQSGDAPTLVVGAHYDSYNDAPGANDNGTGVAATLELARLLKDWKPEKVRIRYVLFVNEEPPYFRTPDMGSWRYAKQLSERGERVRGMISLETMGYFSDKPGSQEFPPPFGLVYPSVGNFIAVVGMPASRSFLHEVMGSLRKHTAFPSIGGAAPDALVPGIGWSDHWAFGAFGFPAHHAHGHRALPLRALSSADRHAREGRLRSARSHHQGNGTGGARDCAVACIATRCARELPNRAQSPAREIRRPAMLISLCNEVIRDLPLAQQFLFARKVGYDGMEIAPFTLADDPHLLPGTRRAEIRTAARDAGLVITSLHYLMLAPSGLSITSSDAAQRRRTVDVMRAFCDLAADLGRRAGARLAGPAPLRARRGGRTRRRYGAECFAAVADAAAKAGVTYCSSAGAAGGQLREHGGGGRSMVRAIGSPAVKTMIDCCAAGRAEVQSIADLLRKCLGPASSPRPQRPQSPRPRRRRARVRADPAGARGGRLSRHGRGRAFLSTSPMGRPARPAPSATCVGFRKPNARSCRATPVCCTE